jgi:hypothetical protein
MFDFLEIFQNACAFSRRTAISPLKPSNRNGQPPVSHLFSPEVISHEYLPENQESSLQLKQFPSSFAITHWLFVGLSKAGTPLPDGR